MLNVHALGAVTMSETKSNGDKEVYKLLSHKKCKVFSYEALQRTLQRRHGRYWFNHAIIIKDVPGEETAWLEQTVKF